MSVKAVFIIFMVLHGSYLEGTSGPAPGSETNAVEGGSEGDAKCNKRLLETFRLDGLEKPGIGKDMTICADVTKDKNCCSDIDEIKISLEIHICFGITGCRLPKYISREG